MRVIKKFEQHETAAESEISDFEQSLGFTLPNDYRKFLKQHNGGVVSGVRLEIPDHRYSLSLQSLDWKAKA